MTVRYKLILGGVSLIDIATFIQTGFKVKQAIFGTYSFAKNTLRFLREEPGVKDIGEISEISRLFFDEDQLSYGNYVSGRGFFCDYAHTYLPFTYSPVIQGKPLEKRYGFRGQRSITWEQIPFPLPVEKLKGVASSSGVLKLGFIYPTNFSGFIYDWDITKEYVIPENARPIPIFYHTERYGKYINNIIDFKAQIAEIPHDYLNQLTSKLGQVACQVFNLSYRPRNLRKKTLCLSLMQDKSEVRIAPELPISKLRAALFVEAHLKNVTESPQLLQAIVEAIPHKPTIGGMTIGGFNIDPTNEKTFYLTTGDVRIMQRDHDKFGFYIESDLIKENIYQTGLTQLRDYYRATSKDMRRSLLNIGVYKSSLELDFLFDYNVQNEFDPRGALVSSDVETLLKTDPTFQNVKSWLTES